MKLLIASIVLLGVVILSANGETDIKHDACPLTSKQVPKEWISMANECTNLMKVQVKIELTAAMKYFAMGAYFSQDTVNRPGFANFFFESASEEREHAIKFASYLSMRGGLADDNDFENLFNYVDPVPVPKKDDGSPGDTPVDVFSWESARDALEAALKLETTVTSQIRQIIEKCEEDNSAGLPQLKNDYHLVDYLTGEFLEEQLKGQRHLAGMLSTLNKMTISHGELADFLFDRKLLHGGV